MARVNQHGLSGTVGNLVFYTVNGVNYVRSKPGKRKKKANQATHSLTTIFGTVSTYGSPLLSQLSKHSLYKLQRSDYNRVRGWMRNLYAQNHQTATWPLVAYAAGIVKINNAVDIRDCLLVNVSVIDNSNGQLAIHIPAFNPAKQMKVPTKTAVIKLKLMVVTSSFGQPVTETEVKVVEQVIPYKDEMIDAINWQLVTEAPVGNIALVALAIEYYTTINGNESSIQANEWLPFGIIAMGKLS